MSELTAHEEDYKGYRIEINYDQDSGLNPRTDYDNGSIFAFEHRRYNLGDSDTGIEADTLEEAIQQAKSQGALAIYVVYLGDHSGLWLEWREAEDEPFRPDWDRGVLGIAYATPKSLEITHGKPEQGLYTEPLEKIAHKVIEGDLKDYDNYLRGNVFEFHITKNDEDIEDAWCGGFLEDYPAEHCLAEARATVDVDIKWREQENVKQLQELAAPRGGLLGV